MKLWGMLLLLMTGTGHGLLASHKLHNRVSSLSLLACLADRLAECVRSTAAPLAVLLGELSGSVELAQLPLWRVLPAAEDVRAAWSDAVASCAVEMALDKEDARLLAELIGGWGAADVAAEVQRCRQYAAVFRERCDAARENARRKGSLYVTLGICGGGAAALLLGG